MGFFSAKVAPATHDDDEISRWKQSSQEDKDKEALDNDQEDCYDQASCHDDMYRKYKNRYFFTAFLPIAIISAFQSLISTSVTVEDFQYKDVAISMLALSNGIIAAIAGYWKWDSLAEKHLTASKSWLDLAMNTKEMLLKKGIDQTKAIQKEFVNMRRAIEGVAPSVPKNSELKILRRRYKQQAALAVERTGRLAHHTRNAQCDRIVDQTRTLNEKITEQETTDGLSQPSMPSEARVTDSAQIAQPAMRSSKDGGDCVSAKFAGSAPIPPSSANVAQDVGAAIALCSANVAQVVGAGKVGVEWVSDQAGLDDMQLLDA